MAASVEMWALTLGTAYFGDFAAIIDVNGLELLQPASCRDCLFPETGHPSSRSKLELDRWEWTLPEVSTNSFRPQYKNYLPAPIGPARCNAKEKTTHVWIVQQQHRRVARRL